MSSPRQKSCKACGDKFAPERQFQSVCNYLCGLRLQDRAKRKVIDAQAKAERRELRERRDAIKSNGELTKLAQREFNSFIRLRDEGMPCPTCGTMDAQWDCGHVKTVAAKPELRFNTLAAFRQCATCNRGAGKYHKNDGVMSARYESWVIENKGQERMDYLNRHHPPKQYRADDLRRIRVIFRRKAKLYRRLRDIS